MFCPECNGTLNVYKEIGDFSKPVEVLACDNCGWESVDEDDLERWYDHCQARLDQETDWKIDARIQGDLE